MKNSEKIVATIECRMTSSRLPGKVMMEVCGKPLLGLMVERLMRVSEIDEIVLATTVNAADDPIEKMAGAMGVGCFRGSEDDVLHRVLEAVHSVKGDLVVGLTGDCPLIDPGIVSGVIQLYLKSGSEYVLNAEPPTYPVGMEVQVYNVSLLELADTESDLPEDHEHVGWFIRRQPKRFSQVNLLAPPELNWPELGLTLDEQDDFDLIREVFEHFYLETPDFSCGDIIAYLRANPELVRINENVRRRSEELIRCQRES